MAEGLRLLPDGAELAARLDLGVDASIDAQLRAQAAPATARGFATLAGEPSLRGRLGLAVRELWPTREFLTWWRPELADRTGGIVLVRAYRIGWLLIHAPSGLIAWWRVRRR
jgi:hypothetical protein